MNIETVKLSGDGYLVNGTISVPKADGNRHYRMVKTWLQSNVAEPEFDAAQLAEQARAEAKATRDTALNAMTHMLADGSVIQTRPIDLTNFQVSIDAGVATDWVLADNTVKLLTVAEMGECLASGVAQAKAIWQTYTDFLKAQ